MVASQFLSCASRATLGKRDHFFSDKAKHIIWLQIEGLLPEHLPLLKYTQDKASTETSFEKMECTGTIWSYNLYKLRTKPTLGFISQILGSQNINGSCSDIDRKPVWSFFQDKGYEVGILESPKMKKRSLDEYRQCKDKTDILSGVRYWRSEKTNNQNAKIFHYLNAESGRDAPGTYYDKSCQKRGCFVSAITNFKSLWKGFKTKNAKTFTVIRDSTYADYLKSGDIMSALDYLRQWDDVLLSMMKQNSGKSLSILITSSAGRGIEFPKQGRQWARFIKKGKSILYRNQSLTSGVWAYGPGTENFCGVYEEDKIFERIIWEPEKRFLDEFRF